MGFNNTAKNAAADRIATLAPFLSLHNADPGSTGTSEVTGGSPAYARKAASWGAASAGVATQVGTATFDVPAGATPTHFGLWSASSGGTFYGGFALSVLGSYVSQGTYALTGATISGS